MTARKIWTILRSEYWRRVRSKAFILTTLLAPIGIVLLALAPGALMYVSQSSPTRVAVVDDTGVLLDRLKAASADKLTFFAVPGPPDSAEAHVRAGRYTGYLHLPEGLLGDTGRATYVTTGGGGLITQSDLRSAVTDAVRQQRLQAQNASPAVMEILQANINVTTRKLTETGTEADSTIGSVAVGWVMGFLIYLAVLIYGQYVMQGVIEEKSSRVVEIVVSSVRPFELMMGKVLGIGAMGLTQFVVWGVLVIAGSSMAGTLAALFLRPEQLNLPAGASQEAMLQAADITLPTIAPSLIVWFVLFFLGGYLLYATLFAAVGSAVEQQQDAQSLIVPITLPLIVPIMFIYFLIESPDAMLSVVLSIIPFFSPVLMVARMALTSVPFWQTALAFVLLVGTFVGAIWLSSRIYRVGILMYGKNPGLRELLRWVTYR